MELRSFECVMLDDVTHSLPHRIYARAMGSEPVPGVKLSHEFVVRCKWNGARDQGEADTRFVVNIVNRIQYCAHALELSAWKDSPEGAVQIGKVLSVKLKPVDGPGVAMEVEPGELVNGKKTTRMSDFGEGIGSQVKELR